MSKYCQNYQKQNIGEYSCWEKYRWRGISGGFRIVVLLAFRLCLGIAAKLCKSHRLYCFSLNLWPNRPAQPCFISHRPYLLYLNWPSQLVLEGPSPSTRYVSPRDTEHQLFFSLLRVRCRTAISFALLRSCAYWLFTLKQKAHWIHRTTVWVKFDQTDPFSEQPHQCRKSISSLAGMEQVANSHCHYQLLTAMT